MSTWQLQEAKGNFSEVVKRALRDWPQGITVRGEPVAVLISRCELPDHRLPAGHHGPAP